MKRIIFFLILLSAFYVSTFAQTDKSACPTINIVMPQSAIPADTEISIAVGLTNMSENYNLQYKWKVSSGEIIDGQGTDVISFLSKKDSVNIRVTVNIKGLPEKCNNTASETFPLVQSRCNMPFDSYTEAELNEEFARFAQLMIALKREPEMQGFIIIEIEENETVEQTKIHIQTLIEFIKSREFSNERLTFVIKKSDAHLTTIYVLPKDVKFPDCENCEILKGGDL